MSYSHIIVGGGTAGCVAAARLAAGTGNRVLLIEAGPDAGDDPEMASGAASLLGRAEYFWPGLQVSRGAGLALARYFQARVLGGGSSINGQISAWNAPADFDRWQALGAEGWSWADVAPAFAQIERDLDFPTPPHGVSGLLAVRRWPETEHDPLSRAIAAALIRRGAACIADANAGFDDGVMSLPFAHDGQRRMSAAVAFLRPLRGAAELELRCKTEVARMLIADGRARGVVLTSGEEIAGDCVILTAGALQSPRLLMLSGIGPADQLRAQGIPVLAERPGVGANLQNHAILSIAFWLRRPGRPAPGSRGMFSMLRYSSGLADCPPGDMWLTSKAGLAWHGIGRRMGMVTTFLGKPFARGTVRLGPGGRLEVDQNLMGDARDVARLEQARGRMLDLLADPKLAPVLTTPVAAQMSERAHRLNRRSWRNATLAGVGGLAMDLLAPLRDLVLRRVVSGGRGPVAQQPLGATIASAWHDCGTCRMGAVDDPLAVTDPRGAVIGVAGLYVADASVMPEIPSTNTNMPVAMLAWRIAGWLAAR